MAPTKKLVLSTKVLNITLTASLVLLANDVSPNPGPEQDSELYLPGYQLLRRDRDRHAGGIAVYVAENLNPERVDISIGDIEALWFELSQLHSKKILFGAVYRPPNLDPSTFTDSLEEANKGPYRNSPW